MNSHRTFPVLLAFCLVVHLGVAGENRPGELSSISFDNVFPSPTDIKRLHDEIYFQRAVQTYLWALPALNLFGMKEGKEREFGESYAVMPVWKNRVDAKTLITTPNTDMIYALNFLDLAKLGPVVVEVPPGLQGIIDDAFQRPVHSEGLIDGRGWAGDVGLPGPDKGAGGKYLLLPPEYDGSIPEGVFAFRPRTNTVMLFWRGFFEAPDRLDAPVRNIERTRIYPLGAQDDAPAMQFPDASGKEVDMLYPRDESAFDMLVRIIDGETVLPEDMEMRGMLAALGIVKGGQFSPDSRQRELLDLAAKTAFNYTHAMVYGPLEPAKRMYSDKQWQLAFVGNADFTSDTYNQLEARTLFFANAYSASPAMAVDMEDAGAKYLSTFTDATGEYLAGEKAYSVKLPADIPAKMFWSLTAYDPATSALLDNGQPFPSINSLAQPAIEPDGSVRVFLGPDSPGDHANWIRTVPGRGYFLILRLYGPTHAFFDKSWKPGDLEVVP